MSKKVSVITPFSSENIFLINRNADSVYSNMLECGFGENDCEHIIVVDTPDKRQNDIADEIGGRMKHVKIIKNSGNIGLPMSRNRGLKVATGEFIMLLDADDEFTPWRFQRQIGFMRDLNLDHSYGGYIEVHGDAPPFNIMSQREIIPPRNPSESLMRLDNVCYCGSNCFRRELVDRIGMFDGRLTGLGAEDLEYWIRILKSGGKQAGMQEVLYRLGVHSANMTAKYIKEGRFPRAYEYIKSKHNI